MVLRLGSSPSTGPGTHFVVVRISGGSASFFLSDDELFRDVPIKNFLPDTPVQELFAFGLLNALTESSALQLGLLTGVLADALDLDPPRRPIVSVSGNGVYSFEFRIDPSYPVVLRHHRGQVEVDALFVARRDGRDTVFVLEAKMDRTRSIAKHKLLYPVLGVLNQIPPELPVVPVYVRIHQTATGTIFSVAECSPLSSGRAELPFLTTLDLQQAKRYRLWLPSPTPTAARITAAT
jgi:hypothetical protein